MSNDKSHEKCLTLKWRTISMLLVMIKWGIILVIAPIYITGKIVKCIGTIIEIGGESLIDWHQEISRHASLIISSRTSLDKIKTLLDERDIYKARAELYERNAKRYDLQPLSEDEEL